MSARVRVAIVLLAPALFAPAYGQAADWALTKAELARLGDGGVLVAAEVSNDRPAGDVRAAVQIRAPAERIFRTLTDCAQALTFVPHLRHCAVLETAADGSSQVVEQEIRYGWLKPHVYYVFRADYERFTRIRFTNIRGDFRENRGIWEFRPVHDGTATIVTYRVRLVPCFFVPRWMLRATLKRDLPELMKGLRARAESQPQAPSAAAAGPAAR
jgi:uncharacterized membrane protein